MARIGERIESRQRLTTGAGTAPQFRADTSISNAVQGLGNSIGQFAERNRVAQEKVDRFKSAKDLETFGAQTDQNLLDSLGQIKPGATGYAKTQLDAFSESSKEFLASVPENLRPEFEVKLERMRGAVSNKAARTELNERHRFYRDGLADTAEKVGRSVESDPDTLEKARGDLIANIESSDLLLDEKERLKDAGRLMLTERAVHAYVKAGQFQKAKEIIGATSTGGEQPRGIRNNNPGNIEANARFGGKVGSDGRFAKFSSPAAGIKAMASQLKLYQSRDGLTTVKGMINRWAPPTENNTNAYVDRVSNAMGISPDQPFNFNSNPDLAQKMVAAMILHENGKQPYSADQIARGVGGGKLPDSEIVSGDEVPLGLSFKDRQGLLKVIDRGQAVESNRVAQSMPDHIASLRSSGIGIDGLADRAATVMNEEQFSEFMQKEQYARRYHSVMTGIKDSAPADMVKTLSSLEPKPGTKDFTEQARLHADLTAGAASELKRRQADPATVAIAQPDVNEAAADMAKVVGNPSSTPEQWQAATDAYATQSLAEQERLGIPMESRRVLTPQQSQFIVRQFNEQSEGGQNSAQMMRVMANQWGSHWPQVLSELGKDLPGGVMVVAAMDTPGQEFAAERLAELSKIGRKALSEGLETADTKEIDKAVTEQISEEFGLSLPDNFTGISTANTVSEAVSLLAIDNFRNGDSVSTAATKAYNDVIGKKYDFVGPGDRLYRVPKEAGALIERGATGFLSRLEDGDAVQNLELPIGFRERLGSDAEKVYQDELSQFGYWVTGPNEEGLVLYDSRTSAAVMVRGDDNSIQPLLRTWDQLSTEPAKKVTPGPGGFAR